jgi:ABC-type Fe3+/spermidine/putrescine transport system ATPase subunit
VAPGEFVALLGPSGCGKTTLLNLIGGFLEPDAGEIWLKGTLVNRLPPYRRTTAMVFQNYALFPHLDVFANIAFGLRMRRVARPVIRERVIRMAETVRLGDLLHRYPSQLSGGQQQRVALARALIVEPAVLLLDEPLSNLDAKLREGVRDEVRAIQRQLGITAVFVTHDQDEAMAMCDRVFVMHAGQIEQVGTPREIYEAPRTAFVAGFIGTFNVFDGEIVSVDSTYDEFQSESGVRLPISHASDRVPGLKGHLLIRPERLRLAARPVAGARSLRGIVARAAFLRTHLRYIVDSAGSALTVDDPRFEEGEFRPGDEVWMILPADPLFLPDKR